MRRRKLNRKVFCDACSTLEPGSEMFVSANNSQGIVLKFGWHQKPIFLMVKGRLDSIYALPSKINKELSLTWFQVWNQARCQNSIQDDANDDLGLLEKSIGITVAQHQRQVICPDGHEEV